MLRIRSSRLAVAAMSGALTVLGVACSGPSEAGTASGAATSGKAPSADSPEAGAASVSEDYVTANGIKFHYLHNGNSSAKKLVVFLHGWPEFSGKWTEYVRQMPKDYFVVAPDLRGYNLTDKPAADSTDPTEIADNYQFATLARDVKEFISALGFEKAYVVAHDWGGMVAWYFTEKYESMVEKLVVMNAPHPKFYAELFLDPTSEQRKAAAYVDLLVSPKAEATLKANDFAFLKKALFEGSTYVFTDQEKAAYVANWSQPDTLKANVKYYSDYVANMKARASEMNGFSTTPVLLFWGQADKGVVEKNVEGIKQYVGNLQDIVYFPDATHWISHEKQAEILPKIVTFLAE